ncbi:cholinesterase ChoE [Pseudomonas aeruginosa]|uniref:cholinesterase ChoE n=1 Tax=Pseudomonas aeruginosa TaxID=287 RepID=UPI001182E76D|nr:cholinesterase ChoE [Pseudomonas aeruginosa]QDR41108.1 GDSL family lipase [Pseudomonas aeruginosa]
MRTRLPALLLGVLLAGQACGHTSPLLAPVRQIHAFGDSYSDNGESQRLTREMLAKGIAGAQALPGEVYWQGRWSNGPTAVEVLARQLGAQLADHAVGGAKSGADNYYGWMSAYRHTGLAGQVDAYLATLDGKPVDGQALHFIFVSANDFFEHEDFAGEQPLEQLAGSSVANIRAAVQRLGEAGARRFLVVSSTDLSVVPAVVAGNRVDQAQRYLQAVNASLPIQLAALRKTRGLELSWFDHLTFSRHLRRNPARYGLVELDAPCQPTQPSVRPACANPDQYYFWDEWHPTRRVHQLAGEAMAARYAR